MVAPKSLQKAMDPAERLNCLTAVEDRGEEIKRLKEVDLQEWVYHVKPKDIQMTHNLPKLWGMC
jgi:hypothetical protein